jgi:O-antigen/teichoic acid export membrane protein
MVALSIVLAPEIGALFARGDLDRLRAVYRTATLWLALGGVPLLALIAWFPSLLLSIVGSSFAGGGTALAVLSAANIVSIALGPIVMVLAMGGNSGSVLLASLVSLAVNVVLNLLLIPQFGVVGAAIAWSVSILTISAISATWCWKLWNVHPIGWALMRVTLGAVVCVSISSAVAREWKGVSWSAFVVAVLLGTISYVPVALSVRSDLHLSALLRGGPLGHISIRWPTRRRSEAPSRRS